MSIKNEMENLVREEVARARREEGLEYSGCWCSLCEADIAALALTMLPPLYCRAETHGHASNVIKASRIRDTVQSALTRVRLRPKHRPGTLPSSRERIALVNYTFEVGTKMVSAALGKSANGCTCSGCHADALAYALNRYPAKYGVTQSGQRNLHYSYIDTMRHELGMLVAQAARVVSTHPRHDGR